jgi:hypothetical protein
MLTSAQDLHVARFAACWTRSDTAEPLENAPINPLRIRQLLMKVCQFHFLVFALMLTSAQDFNVARFAACWTRSDTAEPLENAPTNRLRIR